MDYRIDNEILVLKNNTYLINPTDADCFNNFNFQGFFEWSLVLNKKRDALAYFKYLSKNGKPRDYVFLDANYKYEKLTCYFKKDLMGKRITEIGCDKKECTKELIKKFYNTAFQGIEQNFDLTSRMTGKKYSALAYSPSRNFFLMIFRELPLTPDIKNNYISDCKQVADNLNRVSRSEAVITEIKNPFRMSGSRTLKIISAEVAKCLGLIEKDAQVDNNIKLGGLGKSLLTGNRKAFIKKLEPKGIKALKKHRESLPKEKDPIYFMLHK